MIVVLRGTPGVGKSATCAALLEEHDRLAVVELDAIWAMTGGPRRGGYLRALRRSIDLAHAFEREGCPIVVFSAPLDADALPCALELLTRSAPRVLALHCAPDVLLQRLRQRPAWAYRDEARALAVNEGMRAAAGGIDTTHLGPAEVARRVLARATEEK